jgi:hypothetical protein
VVIGLKICSKLLLTVIVDGQTVFKGFEEHISLYSSPTVIVGKGINFVEGSDNERSQVIEVLIKHKEATSEWSCCYGLFANHGIEISTTGGPIICRAFGKNKHKRDLTKVGLLILRLLLDMPGI